MSFRPPAFNKSWISTFTKFITIKTHISAICKGKKATTSWKPYCWWNFHLFFPWLSFFPLDIKLLTIGRKKNSRCWRGPHLFSFICLRFGCVVSSLEMKIDCEFCQNANLLFHSSMSGSSLFFYYFCVNNETT